MKKEGKLRIYLYGKNALDDVKYLCKKINSRFSRDNKYKVSPFVARDQESNWDYYMFPGEINDDTNETIKDYLKENYTKENMVEVNNKIKKLVSDYTEGKIKENLNQKISELLLEYRNFYDVLIVSIDNLLDEDSKLVFKFMEKFSVKKGQQPFLLFLTKKDKNPDVQKLFEFVTNEFFDKRNVYAKKFPENDREIEDIDNLLMKFMKYYHEIGNTDIKSSPHTFNILICGPAGVGKSSFINQFLQEKIAKEGEGLAVTREITNYFHPRYPIKIFDTPGFEDEYTVQMVDKTIRKFEEDVKDSKSHIDLILYFNQLKERSLYNSETELLQHLIKQNKKMLLVLNDHGNNSKKQRERLIDIMKGSLTQVVNSMSDNEKSRLGKILENIILVNLRQSIDEDDDNEEEEKKIKIKQCFGMDKLFKKIYEMFVGDKISIPDIENAKDDVKELMKNIEKYKLLSNIKQIEDAYINIKIDCSRLILSYSRYDCFVWINRPSRRKELLQIINEKNKGKKIENIDDLYFDIERELKNIKEQNKIVKEFFNSIERFKGIFQTEGFTFDAYWYNEYSLLVGFWFLKKFEEKIGIGQYDEMCKKFVIELGNVLNQAIEAFKELSLEWEETYKSLKAHKSDKEWVNKFFIVEVPKA